MEKGAGGGQWAQELWSSRLSIRHEDSVAYSESLGVKTAAGADGSVGVLIPVSDQHPFPVRVHVANHLTACPRGLVDSLGVSQALIVKKL